MILFDKTALTEKLGRKISNYIDVLLTPESGETDVKTALDKLMNVDIEKLSLKLGNEPAEILIAAAVGFLRLKGGENESAGTVAVDNINEAIGIDPDLDFDTVFRQDFIYELVRAGADQGDPALQAVLCDLYVGDVVSPGLGARFEQDGMTVEQLRNAIEDLLMRSETSDDVRQALGVAGISPKQLLDELDWQPYTENGYALARKYANEGRAARLCGKNDEAAAAFFRSALLGNVESAASYVALTSGLFAKRNRKAELKAYKRFEKTLKKAHREGENGVPDEEISELFDTEKLSGHPGAMRMRSFLLKTSRSQAETLALLENAADNGDRIAQIAAAEHYSAYDSFDFNKMMRFLFEGIVDPGNWYSFGNVRVPFSVISQEINSEVYEKLGELLEKLCYDRDMIDELEELSEQKELKIPALTEEHKLSVFMWFLCDAQSDPRRQVLARLYAAGFGTGEDRERAVSIYKDLCERYAPAAEQALTPDTPDGEIETSEPDDVDLEKTAEESDPVKEQEDAAAEDSAVEEAAPEADALTEEAADADSSAEEDAKITGNDLDEPAALPSEEGKIANDAVEETNAGDSTQAEKADGPDDGDEAYEAGSPAETFRDGPDFMPYESFYAYALYLITAEGEQRDTEQGKKLLKLIPADSRYYRKASRLLALTETRTSELLRLGAMFHKEGNDDAMLKIYDAAEKLGSPVAARVLGRYYSLPENGADNALALRHYSLGASRNDVQSMYFAGSTCQQTADYEEAFKYYSMCADAGENAEDPDDRNAGARAMKDNAELYYSGLLTGEKNVPRYLYWLERAENAGYKLSDASIDKRRAAENYFKPAQWQDVFTQAMVLPDGDGYKEWAVKTCAERRIPAALEEYGVILYKKQLKAMAENADAKPSGAVEKTGAYATLKTPALSSPRAQYYSACALYLGVGCEKDVKAAARILPPDNEFGDPEQLRHEIEGMDALRRAAEAGERHADEAAQLLKKADKEFTAVFDEYGRDNVRFELADILIRAYDVPDTFGEDELKDIWRRGYRYLLGGYRKDAKCTVQIDAYSAGRICEIAGLFEDDEALGWYTIGVNRGDGAARYGAGEIYLRRSRNAGNGKVTDRDALDKAKEMISKAAQLENAKAELAMYTERKLFEIEGDEARLYLKRAAIHGSREAADLCRELEIAF